jgi:hypothetical protein
MRLFGPDQVFKIPNILLQNLAIQKHQCANSLVLRGAGNFFLDSQMGQKFAYMRFSHIFGVLLVMKIDVSLYPADITLFRTNTIMFAANYIAHIVKKARTPLVW